MAETGVRLLEQLQAEEREYWSGEGLRRLMASNARAEREFDSFPRWKRFVLRVIPGRTSWVIHHRDFFPL